MTAIRVGVSIAARRAKVWEDVSEIGSHVEWMADAEAIAFTSDQRSGLGTTFDCTTRVGPVRLNDRMVVTEWKPDEAMGIRHTGLVGGTGRFTLEDQPASGGTRFSWEEQLIFPWWMGGRLGAVVGAVVLRRIWQRNLTNLKRRIESRQ